MSEFAPHPSATNKAPSGLQRGACPTLSMPMLTGDGLLARVALTEGISPRQLAEISRLALRHGNGMMDISARGNLQVRGLTERTAPLLDADIRSLNLPLRNGLAVEVPPFAGWDETEIADPRPLADAIRERTRDLTGLAAKMSVVADGGGRINLSALLADIRLVAVATEKGARWKILLGGTEKSGRVFAILDEIEAREATLDLLRTLAAAGPRARGCDLAHDLPPNDFALSSSASPFGVFPVCENLHAAGIGPAYGQARAQDIVTLCLEAGRLGIQTVKPALDHSLICFGSEQGCERLASFAADHGFITSAADPRGSIAACPGSPACASAMIATSDLATQAVSSCGDMLDGSFKLHITGCSKGCAHPHVSALTLCGTASGISMIADGRATDLPFASVAPTESNISLQRLADLVRTERQKGENSAACIARLGTERLAAAIMSG